MKHIRVGSIHLKNQINNFYIMKKTSYSILLLLVLLFVGCKNNTPTNDLLDNKSTNNLIEKESQEVDTLSILKKAKDFDEIHNILLNSFQKRNNKTVKKLDNDYLEKLILEHEISKENINEYVQINFFLTFLDKNKDYGESLYDILPINEFEPSKDAYKYVERPFNYLENNIEEITEKVNSKKNDSLWVKFYLSEEGINNMLTYYDKQINLEKYYTLLNILKEKPLFIHFDNTERIIREINEE